MIRTTLDNLSNTAWLHHPPYIYHATIKKSTRIIIDIYQLKETNEFSSQNEVEAKILHQKQLCISSQCSHNPRILCFEKLSSREDGQIWPHLVIYDPAIKQLECHAIETENQIFIANIGLDISRMHLYSTVINTAIVIVLKSNKRIQNCGFDILEWTPKQRKLLQGYVEADHIVGIQDYCIDQSWFIFYTSLQNFNHVSISTNTTVFDNASHRELSTTPTYQLNSVPLQYSNNIKSIVTLGQYQRLGGDSLPVTRDVLFDRLWVQTQSRELVHFSKGSIQWSINTSLPLKKMTLVECQTPEEAPLLCIMAHTEEKVFLYDAVVGRLIKDWSSSDVDVILSDVRNVGFYSSLIIPKGNHEGPSNCSIYPISVNTATNDNIDINQGDISKAVANMEDTSAALKKQQQLRLNKIQRLEESLASKRDIIQSCQELADGPLRTVFSMGGVNHSFEDSMPKELLSILQLKKSERRKKVLSRLTPIVGKIIDPGILLDSSSDTVDLVKSTSVYPIRTLDCVSGWIKSVSKKILWIGVHIENRSNQTLSNLFLTISQYNSSGQRLPQLDPQSIGFVVILVQTESSDLDYSESSNRSQLEIELNSTTVLLHVEQKLDQNHNGQIFQYYVQMTNIRSIDSCPNEWRPALVENVLPFKIECRLDNITISRLLVLVQDGFLLSPNEDKTVFGSLEEGMIAKIKPSGASNAIQEMSWDVSFQVETEAVALDCVKKSSLLCPRFA